MNHVNTFKKQIKNGYQCKGKTITLGAAALNNHIYQDLPINIALRTLNRHGLIAGATGTGKTKTIQLLAEKLSQQGIPSLLMDLKGDLSGLAVNGVTNEKINQRQTQIGIPYRPMHYPVELLSLSTQPGLKLRATVSEFGPILFSKMLSLNETQTSIISLIFKFCDDQKLPLLDLKDIKKILRYCQNEGKELINKNYGHISSTSISAILRKIIELEQQGADQFFGEPSFEVEDLLRFDLHQQGYISILRLADIQTKPKLFSSFMLCLLAEVYEKFPEEGDLEKPKLVIFIDEAHLLFKNASKELIAQIENIIKLIRSKGVGIFFCTQNPTDIPDAVLSQLGLKIQHALRAFTAKDRKKLHLIAENYPLSEFYDTEERLTSLGIGEAIITALDENGRPTPLAQTMLSAPFSRMGPLNKNEINEIISHSKLAYNYNKRIDRDSAYEMLSRKIETVQQPQTASEHNRQPKSDKVTKSDWLEQLSKNTLARQIGRTVARELTRGILGILGMSKKSRRKSR